VEAIRRLLNQELQPSGFQISTASLNDSTLHLFCVAKPPATPDQRRIRADVGLFLEALAPQGIRAATLYGQVRGKEAPAWIEWIDLPASVHSALAESPLVLAQQKDWGAIAFLLHRLLNPNLEQYLNTGGIRLQLLPKSDLLHIMSEGYLCPDRQETCTAITRFLEPLQIRNLAGVRIYGRRSGEKQPLWKYAADFISRGQLVPEAMPEFIASADYLHDLLPQDDTEVLLPELTAAEVKATIDQSRHRVRGFIQKVLTRSQLFTVEPIQTEAIPLPGEVSYQGAKVALVWGTLGVLLTVQTNWLLAQALQAQPKPVAQTLPTIAPSPVVPALEPSPQSSPKDEVFNSNGFTRPAAPPATKGSISTPEETDPNQTLPALPYTPPDESADRATAALLTDSPLPTFNSRQLDEKLQLYYQYLEKSGTPDVLIVGSSRALRGIDPIALEEELAAVGYPRVKVFNFGINGATAQVVDLLLQRILTPEQLPRLILWADGARALNSGAVDVTYDGIVASPAYRQLMAGTLEIPRTALDPDAPRQVPVHRGVINQTLTESYATIDRWFSQQLSGASGTYEGRDRLKNVLQQQVGQVFPSPVPQVALEEPAQPTVISTVQPGEPLVNAAGFLSLPLQFNPATYYQKYAKVSGAYDSDYDRFQIAGLQENALMSLLQFTQSQKIPIVFVNLPLTDQYLDAVRSEYEQQFKQTMLSLSMGQTGEFTFRDLGDRWLSEYRYFSDPSHLNRYGAYGVSRQIAQDPLIPWIKGKKR
jgi:hypothetical protein